MKPILKQMMLALAVLLLAAASGSAQVLSPVYAFNASNLVARTEGLLLSGNTFYGTAVAPTSGLRGGGSAGPSGIVFKLDVDGTGFTNLYIFSPVDRYSQTNTDGYIDGVDQTSQLVLSGNRLYGTTERGGFYSFGVVFAVNTDGTGFTNLYNFTDGTNDGDVPSGLVLSGNTLYGTTSAGGGFGGGTVFAINTDGAGFTNLYNFSLIYGGVKSSLVLSNNILYGTTSVGGSSTNGTVFALNTDGTGFTNLYSFSSLVRETISEYVYVETNSDGALPHSGLVISGNVLYGTASAGGIFGHGTLFAVHTDGTDFTNLHSLNGSDGSTPSAGLVLSGNTLYGTAQMGGLSSQQGGAVFAINTNGTGFATLHTFTPTQPNYDSSGDYTNAGGSIPVANLILSGSTLYGAAETGGTNGHGTVFALNLAVAPPTIQFTANPTNGIVRLTVQFSSPAVDSGGNGILAWNWNFGDGSNSVVQNPTHLYTNAATFHPTLSCVNNNGDTVMGSGPAIVTYRPPPIQFTANPTNSPSPPPITVQFTAPAVDAGNNTILHWNWNFGDGSNDTVQNPAHAYTNGGTYFPSLTCTNNNGDTIAGFGPAIVVPITILLNGGFETGTFTNWTQSGSTTYSQVNTVSTDRHSGKYGARLWSHSNTAQGFLSQSLAATPGAAYLISFWLDSPSSATPNDFQVSWDGNVLLDETNLGAIGWTNIQLTATATATSATLQFGYLGLNYYAGLDDVIVTPMTQPNLVNISLSGTDLVLDGINGVSGSTNYLLMSTNLTQPLDQWTPVATNVLGASGNFTVTATNAVDPNAPRRFYILQLQ